MLISGGRRRSQQQPEYLPGRLLVWEDDFNGDELSLDDWSPEDRRHFASSLQFYTSRPDNIRVADSCLVIDAIREPYDTERVDKTGATWTSAQMTTYNHHLFHYGRFEARMKLPLNEGMWPAFWTVGWMYGVFFDETTGLYEDDGVGYLGAGEVDIHESYGASTDTTCAVHAYYWSSETVGNGATYGPIDRSQWHTYAAEWTEDSLEMSCDGVVFKTYAIQGGNLRIPHALFLNLAVQGGAGAPGESTPSLCRMLVDWVRVYAPEGDTEILAPTSVTFDRTSITMAEGSGDQLIRPTILPADVRDKGIAWVSSNPSVAPVASGWVRRKSPGTAVITGTTTNGLVATCTVTVT